MSNVATNEVAAPAFAGILEPVAGADRVGWIHSRGFDLTLLTLSPISGILLMAAVAYGGRLGEILGIGCFFLVGVPHYVSSFSFYLGDDNLAYYKTRRLAFFLGPAVVFGVVLFMRTTSWNDVLQSVIFSWNIFHVSRQSSGILALYRRLAGGDPLEKPLADAALLSLNGAMAFWYIERFPQFADLLRRAGESLPSLLGPVMLAVAVVAWIQFFGRLAQRRHRLGLAEGSFLISSAVLFHPYLWIKDSNQATFVMLMGHFIQYLAIVWLLNRRKYANSQGSMREQVLGAISRNWVLLGGTLFLAGISFYAVQKVSLAVGASSVYLVLWSALAVVHFYVDGLVWAFKRPFVRQSIGPYLTPDSHMVPQ